MRKREKSLNRINIYISITVVSLFGIFATGCGPRKIPEQKFDEVRIGLYRDGEQSFINKNSHCFSELLQECGNLFETADTTYMMIFIGRRVRRVKEVETALEVIWPKVRIIPLPYNHNLKLWFTKILIPLSGEWANGTVFYSGICDYTLSRLDKGYVPGESEADYFFVASGLGVVINTRGLSELKPLLRKMGIE
jgi:hypothetical protein